MKGKMRTTKSAQIKLKYADNFIKSLFWYNYIEKPRNTRQLKC